MGALVGFNMKADCKYSLLRFIAYEEMREEGDEYKRDVRKMEIRGHIPHCVGREGLSLVWYVGGSSSCCLRERETC